MNESTMLPATIGNDVLPSFTPDAPVNRRSTPLARFYGPLLDSRTWKETAGLLVAMPLGVAWFTVAVTGLSLAAGMAITLVGIPILVATILFGRLVASAERAKARALHDCDLPGFAPIPRDSTAWVRAKRVLGDLPGWRGLLYGVLALPLGVLWFTVAVVVWSVSLAAAGLPLYHWLGDDGSGRIADGYVLHGWGHVGAVAGVTVAGLILLGLAPRIVHAMSSADRKVIRCFLSSSTAVH